MRLSYASWIAFLQRHHRRIVLASALLGVLCALSLTRLRLDIDVLNMLPQGSPAFDEFRTFVGDLGELNQLVILVEGAPLPQLQQFADEMAARLARLDTVARVQSRVDVDRLTSGLLGRYLYNCIREQDYDEVARRLTPQAIEAQMQVNRAILSAPFDLSAARGVAEDPLGLRRLAAGALGESYASNAPSLSSGYVTSKDGGALLLVVRAKASGFDPAFSQELLHRARRAADEARAAVGPAAADIRVAYTGAYVYALEDQATLQSDIRRYTLLALVGVLAVFYAGYRNLRILPFVTYPLLLATLTAFALSLVFYSQLNAVSLCFAAILYGLSIDSAIHYYTRVLQERDRAPDLRAAVTAAVAALGRPIVAASATTGAAFVVIGISALSAVSEMGLLTALGMAVSVAFFFTLYPALTFALAKSFAASPVPADTPRLGRVGGAATRHARLVVAASVVAGLALILPAMRIGLDVSLFHLRPADSEAVRVQDEIEERFGVTQTSGAVVVRRRDLERALADSEAIARRLRSYRDERALRTVHSVEGALPSAAAQRERLRRFNALPRAEAAATLSQALARHGFSARKFSAFLETFATPRSEADIVRLGAAELDPLAPLIDHHVREYGGGYVVATYFEVAEGVPAGEIAARLERDLPGIELGVASRMLLEEELAGVLKRELAWFCVFGVGGNLLLLLFIFRHVGTAMAILTPVILVVVALFAGMTMAGIALDPVNLIVTPLILGLGVDYGCFVVARARECGDVAAALRLSGRALVVTSLTTVAGFGFLALSRYPFLATMGLLAGIGLCLCLVAAVVLVPAMLVVFAERGAPINARAG